MNRKQTQEDDVKVLREALKVARDLEGRTLLLDGCFPDATMERAMQLRALHQRVREVAEELEALAAERNAEPEDPGVCVRCEDAPRQWASLCGSCLQDASIGWPSPRRPKSEPDVPWVVQ